MKNLFRKRGLFPCLALAFAVLFTAVAGVQAEQNRGQNRNRAVAAQKARNARAKQAARNRAVDRALLERELRRRELIDFNRRLLFRSVIVDPFVVNPFVGSRFFFANRNFAIGF